VIIKLDPKGEGFIWLPKGRLLSTQDFLCLKQALPFSKFNAFT